MLDHAAGRGAGVVDHDVDAAERLVRLLDEVLGVGVLAQVGRDGDDLAVGRARDLGGGGFQHVLAARADRDIDALLGEREGDALADALAAAGDERGLAVELQVHVSLLCRSTGLSAQDGFGGVADGFDILAGIEEGDDAARAAFEALVAPREGADDGALAEHQLDVAAEVLGVQQAFLERPVVEREHVGATRRPDFLWVYSKVPKNSPGVLPCFLVNSSARSGRM